MHLHLILVFAYLCAFTEASSSTSSTEIDSTTTDFVTSTATDTTTAEYTTTDKTTVVVTDPEDDASTTDATSKSTTDGATTTTADETTTTEVSSTSDTPSTTSDITTSTAAETTTTELVTSTTIGSTTSVDPDTTTGTETTTTDNNTSSVSLVTASALSTTDTLPESTTDVDMNDDIRNYVIIVLSLALGILCIGIIVWCVWSKVQRTDRVAPSKEDPYKKKNLVSTSTQTDDFYFSKGFNVRPLPPIGTHLELISEKSTKDAKAATKSNLTEQIEIVREKNITDVEMSIFSEKNCFLGTNEYETYVDIPRGNGIISEDPGISSESEKEHCKTIASNDSKPVSSSNPTDTETISSKTESIEVSYEDIFCVQLEGSSENYISHDRNKLDCTNEHSENPTVSLSVKEEGTASDTNSETLEKGEIPEDTLFIRTSLASSNLEQADDEYIKPEAITRSSIEYTGLENKKQTFQIKHCINEEEDVEEIIMLEPEDDYLTKRHVTFTATLEQEHRNDKNRDNGVTLFGPGFRGLINTNADQIVSASREPRFKRKRKRSTKAKPGLVGGAKSLNSPYSLQNRYSSTYQIIVNTFFKPERTEDKVWKKLKKPTRRKKHRKQINANRRINIKLDEKDSFNYLNT